MKISTQSQAVISNTTIIPSLLICLCLPNNVHKFFPREIKSSVFLWFSPPEGVLHKSPRYPPIQPKVQRSPLKALTVRWLLWKRDWTEKKEGENLPRRSASHFLGWCLFYICVYRDLYIYSHIYIRTRSSSWFLCVSVCIYTHTHV